ncbi:MAG TPA: diguanylate cyclase [Kiloniellales bacterium]|jgi:diguanylate cyclase (GGDEF)-like protein
MRIRRGGAAPAIGTSAPADASPAKATPSTERADRTAGTAPAPDAATLAGIPQTELTPRVSAAIGMLMAEVQKLREELAQSKKRIEFLETLADQDALAPVLNRRAFVRELTRMMAYAERYDVPGSVLYFDVDQMKQVNDDLGHAAGDVVLRRVAETLVRESRASDVVGRLGGDEYAVILSQADAHTAAAKAATLAKAIAAEPIDWQGEQLLVTVSYGVHSFAGVEHVEAALDAADRAMYARKRRADDDKSTI